MGAAIRLADDSSFWGVGGGQKTLLTFSDESVLLKVLRVREKSAALQNGGILK